MAFWIDAMYCNKTGKNAVEQLLASFSIRVQSEPKVTVHLPEMSIFSPCTLIQIRFSYSQERKVGRHMCHKSQRP